MKKINSLLILAMMVVIFASCSDDNQTPVVNPVTNAGTLTVNGVTTTINNGFIILPYTGTNPDYNNRRFYVILTDGTIAMENNDLVYSDNIHQLIDFNLYTDEDFPGAVQNVAYGLYIPGTGFDISNPFIDHTAINTNVIVQNGEYISGQNLDSDDMDAGQLNIDQANGIYTLSFSFSNDGNTVAGKYTGSLSELNYQF